MIQKLIPRLLNMESDEVLVKPNEFVDAINVKIDGEDGTDFGVIKHADGNTVIDFLDAGGEPSETEVVTGFCEDESLDTIYLFCAGTTKDSIYMVSKTDVGYKMVTVARSSSFDLDKDKFTAANILRVFDKEIQSFGDELGGGSFSDGDQINDFNPDGVVDVLPDEGDTGFVDISVIPTVNELTNISFFDVFPQFPNQTFIVQNQGTNTGEITFEWNITTAAAGMTIYKNVAGQSADTPVTLQVGPNGQTVVQLDTTIYGTPNDLDVYNFEIIVTSDSPGFIPVVYNWSTELRQTNIAQGTPSYSPPSLSGGEFLPILNGTSSNQQKVFSISNVPAGEGVTVPLRGVVWVEQNDLTGQLVDMTTLSSSSIYSFADDFVTPNDGETPTIYTADIEAEGISFEIPAGETFNFTLDLSADGSESLMNGGVNLKIRYYSDSTYGIAPPSPSVVTGQTMSVSIYEEQGPADVFPIVLVDSSAGLSTVGYTMPPYSLFDTDLNGANVTGIHYDITEGAGATFTVKWNFDVLLDSSDGAFLSNYIRDLFVSNNTNGVYSAASFGSFNSTPSEFQYTVDSTATPGNPYSIAHYFQINYGASAVNPEAVNAVREFVNNQDAPVGVLCNLRATVLETNQQIIEQVFSVVFEPVPDYSSVSIEALYGNAQGILTQSAGGFVGTTEGPGSFTQVDVGQIPASAASGNTLPPNAQVLIKATNVGSVDANLPSVFLSNTKGVYSGGSGYLGSLVSGTYLSDPLAGVEWNDNQEFWLGYGNLTPSEMTDLLGPENVQQGNTSFYNNGITDLLPAHGWQVRYVQNPGGGDPNINQTAYGSWGGFAATTTTSATPAIYLLTGAAVGSDEQDLNTFFEPADNDTFDFDLREVDGWSGFGIESSLISPWFRDTSGDINSNAGDAMPTTFEQATNIPPGESIYLILNCNMTQNSNEFNFQAGLVLTAPPGSQQALDGRKWKFLLNGDTPQTGGSPAPKSSGRQPYTPDPVEMETEGETETTENVNVIQNTGPVASELTSEKALKRSGLKRLTKDGIKY